MRRQSSTQSSNPASACSTLTMRPFTWSKPTGCGARRGPGAGDWGADSMPLGGSSTGVAIAQGRPVHFPDLADKADLPEDKRTVLKETGGMTVLYAPMISQDSGVG